ncbi:hypothetical protein LguiA_003879 [Lonicera macranthoides]
MDLDDIRTILSNSRVDVWTLMDAAIALASSEYGEELKHRRDGIVERLYAPPAVCRNCDGNFRLRQQNEADIAKASIERENCHEGNVNVRHSPYTPQSIQRDDDDDDEETDPYGGLFDDEQTKILKIKEQLEDPEQSEDGLVELLRGLADMDITFKALKETDIGRHVNRLRKNPSNEVRRLVKQLVRKWKDLVDEWVSRNPPENASSNLIADGDSPQQNIPKNPQYGHHQVPDFAYSPNPHNGSSGSERNNSEPEQKPKVIPRREPPSKPPHSAPPPVRPHKESTIDAERLASARRRLHENYQEANNGLDIPLSQT